MAPLSPMPPWPPAPCSCNERGSNGWPPPSYNGQGCGFDARGGYSGGGGPNGWPTPPWGINNGGYCNGFSTPAVANAPSLLHGPPLLAQWPAPEPTLTAPRLGPAQIQPLHLPNLGSPQLGPPMLAPVPPQLDPESGLIGSKGTGVFGHSSLTSLGVPTMSQQPIRERSLETVRNGACDGLPSQQFPRDQRFPAGQPSLQRSRSDETLRSTIKERFAGAYENQIGHLARVAADEQKALCADIETLRNMAYMAQRNAVDQRARTEHARRALAVSAQESWKLREALRLAQSELTSQISALQQTREGVRREEHASAEMRARAREESADLNARCQAAHRHRLAEEEMANSLLQELEVARAERMNESKIATEHRLRAEAAERAREQALQGLSNHEEHAMKALKDAVGALETDFANERLDIRERDRQTFCRIQELEREFDQRRSVGTPANRFRSPLAGVGVGASLR
eukprot:TRINITY_DN70023_c0_g1_i1.p1 TRINITY_DN70023_c0_g1~~TRINITY_DN70023_c0_g1_i1.p1  ORF type:complete len:479 (+),score=65.00 TRINITY_DN70023_c0_g1_i1:59-1438(+)